MDNLGQPVQQNSNTLQSPEGQEVYGAPNGQATQPELTPSPAPEKKSSRAGVYLLWVLVVLLFAGLGTVAYWQWTEAQSAKKELSSAQEQAKLATDQLKESSENGRNQDTATSPQPKSDDILVKEAVTAEIHAQTANKSKQVTVTVKKLNSEFALVTLFEGGEGGTLHYILKKVDEKWVPIYDGLTAPDATTVNTYSIPAEYAKF